MDYITMGKRIRQARKEQHITQIRLAEIVGLSSSFLGHIERGTRTASIESLYAICKALHLSADYLLGLQAETAIKPILGDFTQEEIEAGIKLLQRLTEKNSVLLHENS